MTERMCPVDITKLPLVDVPYEMVADVFVNLTQPPTPDRKIGGIKRHGRPYFQDSDHIEMSFTLEQHRYVKTVTALLYLIAKRGTGNLAYGDVVINAYATNFPQNPAYRYVDALELASVQVLRTFSATTPNLMPALHGIFELEGAGGMRSALMRSKAHLDQAQRGNLVSEIRKEDFIAMQENDGIPSELHCASESFGRTLVLESKRAATTLASSFPTNQNSNLSTESVVHYDNLFRNEVRALAHQTAQNNAQYSL